MPKDASLENFSPEEIEGMAAIYSSLVKDPTTRETALRLTKKVAPQTSIPEIDVADRLSAQTKPLQDKIEAMTAKEIERENADRLRAARQELRDAGHSAEDIASIEKLMLDEKKEGNILTHKKASEFFRLQQQTAQPAPSTLRINQMPVGKDKIKEAGGIRRWGAIEAGKAIDDLRAGRVKLH